MRSISISELDAAQVAAILNVHAEMQDARINEIGPVLARLKRDEPDAAAEVILDMEDALNLCEDDAENLKRIAQLFKLN